MSEDHKAPTLADATHARLHADAAPLESKEAPPPKPPAGRFSDGRRSVAQPQEAPRRRDAQARRADEERGPLQIAELPLHVRAAPVRLDHHGACPDRGVAFT